MDFVKRTVGLVTALGVLSIIGCENPIADITFESSDESNVHIYGSDTDTTEIAEDTLSSVMFNLLLDLELDGNGFYHLPIDTTKWQTLHRVTSVVTRDSVGVNVIKVSWNSNRYWMLGDTMGYVIQNTGSDDFWYVGYDTTYITWFEGFEVPVVNGASYSDMHGEVNTMIAPVRSMRGDTMSIFYSYYDDWKLEETTGEFSIVLD